MRYLNNISVVCIKSDNNRFTEGKIYKLNGPIGLFIISDDRGDHCSFGNDPIFWTYFREIREHNLNTLGI